MREKDRHSDSAELTYRTNPNRRENGEFDFGPDRGARGQSSGRLNGRAQNHDSQKSGGNYIDKLAESEQKLFRQNGIMFESGNITTKLSDKKEDMKSPKFKLGFKHGGFGNGEIHVGKGDDFTGDPHEKDHIWGAFHARLTGLKKNAKYTVIQDHKFRSKIWDSYECEFAEVVAAHEIQTDARGDAYLLRVGVTEAPVAMGNKESGELKDLGIAEIDLDLKLLEGPVGKHFEKVKKLGGYTNKVEYVIRHATLNNGGEVEKSIADKLGGKLIFSGRFVKDATIR